MMAERRGHNFHNGCAHWMCSTSRIGRDTHSALHCNELQRFRIFPVSYGTCCEYVQTLQEASITTVAQPVF